MDRTTIALSHRTICTYAIEEEYSSSNGCSQARSSIRKPHIILITTNKIARRVHSGPTFITARVSSPGSPDLMEEHNGFHASSGRFNELEDHLEQFVEKLRVVGVIASDFQPGSQPVLDNVLNRVVEDMTVLERHKDNYRDVHVPLEVISYIDEGKNPELYSKHQLEQTLAKYQAVGKKVEAYKALRDQLLLQLNEEFPSWVKTYQQQQNS